MTNPTSVDRIDENNDYFYFMIKVNVIKASFNPKYARRPWEYRIEILSRGDVF